MLGYEPVPDVGLCTHLSNYLISSLTFVWPSHLHNENSENTEFNKFFTNGVNSCFLLFSRQNISNSCNSWMNFSLQFGLKGSSCTRNFICSTFVYLISCSWVSSASFSVTMRLCHLQLLQRFHVKNCPVSFLIYNVIDNNQKHAFWIQHITLHFVSKVTKCLQCTSWIHIIQHTIINCTETHQEQPWQCSVFSRNEDDRANFRHVDRRNILTSLHSKLPSEILVYCQKVCVTQM